MRRMKPSFANGNNVWWSLFLRVAGLRYRKMIDMTHNYKLIAKNMGTKSQ